MRGIAQITSPTALTNARRRADALLRDGTLTSDDAAQIVEAIEARAQELAQSQEVQGD